MCWASSSPEGSTLYTGAVVSATTADPVPGNDTAQASTAVEVSAGVAIALSGPASVTRGTQATYTVTVSNAGPSDAVGVSVTSDLPAGATFVSNAGACTTAFPCDLGTVASGGSATFTTTVAVAPGYAGATPLVHTVTAAATSSDPDGADNVASASSAVDSSADVAVALTGPSAAERGKTVEYSITVENLGPSDAEGVSLDAPSSAGLTFVSNAGDCTTGFPCTLGTLAPGSSRTVTATFTVNKNAPDGPLPVAPARAPPQARFPADLCA